MEAWVPNLTRAHIPKASHWIMVSDRYQCPTVALCSCSTSIDITLHSIQCKLSTRHHLSQNEFPDETNKILLDWLGKLPAKSKM
jgi:hypothetical protein